LGQEQTVKETFVVAPGRIGGLCHDTPPVFALVVEIVVEPEPEVVSEKIFPARECAIVFIRSLLGVLFHRSSLAMHCFRRRSLKRSIVGDQLLSQATSIDTVRDFEI